MLHAWLAQTGQDIGHDTWSRHLQRP